MKSTGGQPRDTYGQGTSNGDASMNADGGTTGGHLRTGSNYSYKRRGDRGTPPLGWCPPVPPSLSKEKGQLVGQENTPDLPIHQPRRSPVLDQLRRCHKQREALVHELVSRGGHANSLRELRDAAGLTQTALWEALKALQAAGYLTLHQSACGVCDERRTTVALIDHGNPEQSPPQGRNPA